MEAAKKARVKFGLRLTIILVVALLAGVAIFNAPRPLSVDSVKNLNRSEIMNLRLTNLKGRAKSLEEFRGKVILLNFWASWCAPCLEELPLFNRLQEEWSGQGFVVVAINVEEETPRDFIDKFWQDEKIAFETFVDSGQIISQSLDLSILPTTFVIGRNGEIAITTEGYADWSDPKVKSNLLELLRVQDPPRAK